MSPAVASDSEPGSLSEAERIDRELRRRVLVDRDALDSQFECEGCTYRSQLHDHFEKYHGLFLCAGCADHAREMLRELQEPLIERLAARPTVDLALALGFELRRRDDGRLVWLGEGEEYDGGDCPYADEREALDGLVGELW